MLGEEKALELVEECFRYITQRLKISDDILNNEQNNFVHQNYADRSLMIAPNDQNDPNERIHNDVPNTFN